MRKPYVLFVGILKPHKNLQGLLRAFSLLPEDTRRPVQLVIVGKKDSCYPHLLELGLRRVLSERCREQAKLFSARKCALDHLEVYRAALSS